MAQMTGFVIRDGLRRLIFRRRLNPDVRQPFVNVFDLRIPKVGAPEIGGIIGEEMTVRLVSADTEAGTVKFAVA